MFVSVLNNLWHSQSLVSLSLHMSHRARQLPCVLQTPNIAYIQPGAVKLVLWRHWMHLSFMHPVTSKNQFHCTKLYKPPSNKLSHTKKVEKLHISRGFYILNTYLPTVPISSGQSRFEDRNPTSRPTTQKADSSRFVPINAPKHDFKPAFCLFSLFFSQNSSFFCVFWPFFMYPSAVGRYPNKKSVYLGIVLVKKFFLLSFSSERKKLCIYLLQ